jgi:LysR family transcriptional regulator for bpeEF and oprC
MLAVHSRRKHAINDIYSCVNGGLANIGIVQLPYFGVRNYISNGQSIQIFPEESPLYIVYLQNRHLSANVRAFVDWVMALFKKEEAGYLTSCENV